MSRAPVSSDPLAVHTAAVIDEYLAIAHHCVTDVRPGRPGWGYPAALLLFTVVDAIGHGVLPPRKGSDARLEVLREPPFDLDLSDGHIGLLKKVYRNTLSHNAQLGRGAGMMPETSGQPFDFKPDGTVILRVPVFYRVVVTAWEKCRTTFAPPDGDKRPESVAPKDMLVLSSGPGEVSSTRPI